MRTLQHRSSSGRLTTSSIAGVALLTTACSSGPQTENASSSRSAINNGTPVASTGLPPYVAPRYSALHPQCALAQCPPPRERITDFT
jgi:hypothetical protein